MTDFITLTCPACGGKLKITKDVQQFACAYCGTEHRINRSTSVVSLSPVVEGIGRVQVGVDKTASELAITRLNDEILYLENEYAQDYARRNALIMRIIVWGLIGLIGLGALASGLRSGATVTSTMGFVVVAVCFFQIFRNIRERSALTQRMRDKLQEARRKDSELKTHQQTVSG